MIELDGHLSDMIGRHFIHKYAAVFDLVDDDGYSLDYISTFDMDQIEDIAEDAYNYWDDNCKIKVHKPSFINGIINEILMYRRRNY